MENVKATYIVTYEVECPNCKGIIYSELADDWNTEEMIHSDECIKCPECETDFLVSQPD